MSPKFGQNGTETPLIVAVLTMAIVIALATLYRPILGFVLVGLLLLGLCVAMRPNVATLAVVFILYTNAATIAVKFHGAPSVVSAGFLLLLLIPLAYILIWQRQPVIITPVVPLLVVYLLIQLVSMLFIAKDIKLSLPNLFSFLTEGILLYLLTINVVRTPEMLRRVIWVLLAAGLFMGSLSIFQQVTHTLHNNYGGFAQNEAQGEIDTLGFSDQEPLVRQAGPIGEKNRYSQIMLMLVPLGMFRFWGERSRKLRLLAAASTFICIIGSVLTFSRGGAVGLGLMIAIMVMLRYIKLRQIVVVSAALVIVLLMFPRYTERLMSLQSLTVLLDPDTTAGIKQTDGAIQGRATEMLAAAYVFADHPVLGVGPGMFPHYVDEYARKVGIRTLTTNREAHVLYLDIAADSGIVGLVCFLAIVYVSLRDLVRGRRQWSEANPQLANMCASFMFVIVTYLTTGLFLHMSYARYFWFMLALANVASYIAAHTAESTDKVAIQAANTPLAISQGKLA